MPKSNSIHTPSSRYVRDPTQRIRAATQRVNYKGSHTALSGSYQIRHLNKQIEKLRRYPLVSI